ncbi:hypothetical protein [Opitutus sp. ER46]|uniref:hypothetical protein n=1 Tax=Opitutus sp. ER46 TaxID=2161864 RepID=UPI000D2F79F7|nr:hypothetical protein [Opitutus sp. ER46]PTX97881.1 hypothetical protein DB354_06270 [Opitutus sp. ER46]
MKPRGSTASADQRPRLNADWHRANRMPKNPSTAQRVAWHVAHTQACACRPIPASILAELSRHAAR